MYEPFFELDEGPFIAAPSPKRYFATESTEHVRRTLTRVIQRAEGPGLIIGAPGTGKTLLCQVLAEQLRDQFRIAMLACARPRNRRTLLQSILFELNLPYRNKEEGELRLALMDHLEPRSDCPNGLVLLIDEAHTHPSQLLEEVRLITNFIRDGRPRVRLILAGCPLLEERLASPKLESLNQRLAARCYLSSFQRQETADYVRWRIQAAGGGGGIFSSEALEAVYRATEGVPRLVNQVCDHALRLAAAAQLRRIGPAQVEEAWADLQQLPLPCQGAVRQADAGDSDVLEFGQLEDFDEPEVEEAPAPEPNEIATDPQGDDASESPCDPCEQIENIELRVAEIRAEDAAEPHREVDGASPLGRDPCEQQAGLDDSGEPRQRETPEVELVFHDVANPFDEPFEEEEIVLDRYASMETETMIGWPSVSGPESLQIAAALGAWGNPAPLDESDEARPAPAFSDDASFSPPEDEPQGDFAADALNPAAAAHSPTLTLDAASRRFSERPAAEPPATSGAAEDPTAAAPRAATLSHPAAEGDDRDILIVEEDQAAPVFGAASGAAGARRREYSQLFARLRRG